MKIFGLEGSDADSSEQRGQWYQLAEIHRRLSAPSDELSKDPLNLFLTTKCWRCDPFGEPLANYEREYSHEDECQLCEGDEFFWDWVPLSIIGDIVREHKSGVVLSEETVIKLDQTLYPGEGPYLMDVPWPSYLLDDVHSGWLERFHFAMMFLRYCNSDVPPEEEILLETGVFTSTPEVRPLYFQNLIGRIDIGLFCSIIEEGSGEDLDRYDRGIAWPAFSWDNWCFDPSELLQR